MSHRPCPRCQVLVDARDLRCACGYDFFSADEVRRTEEAATRLAARPAVPKPPLRVRFRRAGIALLSMLLLIGFVAGVRALWRSRRIVSIPVPGVPRPSIPKGALPSIRAARIPPVEIVRVAGVAGESLLLPDGQGGAMLIWIESRGSGGSAVLAQRITSRGELAWRTTRGVTLSGEEEARRDLAGVADGAGGAYLAWTERRGPVPSVRLQHLNRERGVDWKAGGVSAGAFARGQEQPVLAGDSQGVTVVWRERSPDGEALFANRFDRRGSGLWAANGVPLFSTTGTIVSVLALGDGAGGTLIAWSVSESAPVHVLRLNADSATAWSGTLDGFTGPPAWMALQGDASGGGATLVWKSDEPRPARFLARRLTPKLERMDPSCELGRVTLGSSCLSIVLARVVGPVLSLAWEERTAGGRFALKLQHAVGAKGDWPMEGLSIAGGEMQSDALGCLSDGRPQGGMRVAAPGGAGEVSLFSVRGKSGLEWRSLSGSAESAFGEALWISIVDDGKEGAMVAWSASLPEGRRVYAVQRFSGEGVAGVWDDGGK